MRAITAIFKGKPGDKKSMVCHDIFMSFGGEMFNEGTYLPTMTRDIGYDVPDLVAPQLCKALTDAGFTVDNRPTPTPEEMDQNEAEFKTLEGRTIVTMEHEKLERGHTEVTVLTEDNLVEATQKYHEDMIEAERKLAEGKND